MSVQTINEIEGIKPLAKYSFAKIVDPLSKLIFLSGQIPINEVSVLI